MRSFASVRLLSLFLSALSTGVFFGTQASLGPSTRRFNASTYVEVQQATIRNLRPTMGALLPGAVLFGVIDLVLGAPRRSVRSSLLTGAGVAGQALSLVLTVTFELPINSRVMSWGAVSPPRGWERLRDRWAAFHLFRTVTAIIGLALTLVGH